MKMVRPASAWLIGVVLVWATTVSGGVVWVWNYKTTPGLASGPPATWPASIALQPSGMTLVMTLHPLCTCSHASVSELARLMAGVPAPPTVYAVFIDFSGRPESESRVTRTPLWERAAAIPGVVPVVDRNGAIAKSFSAETSGDVIAYSATGRLLFQGGLTPARGHEGDSFGRQRLLAVLRGDDPDAETSPVFGCPLNDPPPTRSELE
jgi:CBS domain-containing protein